MVKRKGFNLIDTVTLIKEIVADEAGNWPAGLKAAVELGTSNDQSRQVQSMVSQLEGSVLTAIALVMIVTLAALGLRAALLVGFAIPTSFLLCFALLAVMGVSISNIVMFGLILAVGMLVDGAIVVVEYANKQQARGTGPMKSYVIAAKRMFWPVISSTATTLCAFLPMLFWPGVPGEFMGMLPVTLIFVLSASLVVALIYLPVMGGVTGRVEQWLSARMLRIASLPWYLHLALFPLAGIALVAAGSLVPVLMDKVSAVFATMDVTQIIGSVVPVFISVFVILVGVLLLAGIAIGGAIIVILALLAIFTRISIGGNWLASKVLPQRREKVSSGYQRNLFGRVIGFIAGNPIMPLVTAGAVFVFVGSIFIYFSNNNRGVEFFVESETEQAIVYVRARGNLSLVEKDTLVQQAEEIILAHPGVSSAFAFAGEGGLNANTGGSQAPNDTIGQVQLETIPWETRRDRPELDGDLVVLELTEQLAEIPGIEIEILSLSNGPGSGKPVHLRIRGENWEELKAATAAARAKFDSTPGLTLIEDTLPLPGIDWEISVDVEKAGRYGADVATVGGMVQLVTRGILLDTMRVATSDEEIEIRVRLPEEDRLLSTLDSLKVRTRDGLVPLSNFVTRKPVPKLAQISRVNQKRFFDVKADVLGDLAKLVDKDETIAATLKPATGSADVTYEGRTYDLLDSDTGAEPLQDGLNSGDLFLVPVNPNERIAELTKWLETSPFAAGLDWEWTGDQEEQEESAAFLSSAFSAALGLMFIILLAQFNSFYNAILVLVAVILSTTGVLIGMLVMQQPFSIIMTGTGIVALAGIVVNNNIVLIDTYQEYARVMPRVEAITRTAQDRIRPVLLTTITTMAGLAPMMLGLSLDFANGGYSIDSPTALWWKQLATAVVFGLGIATVLTLVVTPSMLAARVWATTYVVWLAELLAKMSMGRASRAARDWALQREAARSVSTEILWDFDDPPATTSQQTLRAAE